ncbi:MAG: cobyric acid synthase CobQ, partial [Spirochaetes bacterium RIFOXYC1_FULL_54_7]
MAAPGGRSFHGGDTAGLTAASGLPLRDILDASANINPLGPPDWLDAAFAEGRRASGRYPDPACRQLRAAASLALGIPADCLVFGNGADELMFALARALGRPGTRLSTHASTQPGSVHIIEAPSYASYRDAALDAAGIQTVASMGTEPAVIGTELWVIPARLPPSVATQAHLFSVATESCPSLPTGNPVSTPLDSTPTDYQRWSEALAESPPGSVLWIGAPNNPTGLMPEGYPDIMVRLAQGFPDRFILCDEAFIEFVDGAEPGGAGQSAARLPNLVVIQSMTKFWAVPGLRAGYVICHPQLAGRLRAALPNWPLNCVAEAFARRAFTDPAAGKRRDETRRLIRSERARTAAALAALPCLDVRESAVNFYLVRVLPGGLAANLTSIQPGIISAEALADAMATRGIGLRRCASFPDLGPAWLRIAVRRPDENDRIIQAMREILYGLATSDSASAPTRTTNEAESDNPGEAETESGAGDIPFDHLCTNGQIAPAPAPLPPSSRACDSASYAIDIPQATWAQSFIPYHLRSFRPSRTQPYHSPPNRPPALMIQGCSSGAGKSLITAAFCRIFRDKGYDVAPYKAQNMSLNSAVTMDGLELGRAQAVQAAACGLEPDVRMNPVLLKPESDRGSQIVLMGKPYAKRSAQEYYELHDHMKQTARDAYDSLAAEHQLMVLEGAGSPGEINLKSRDFVNMEAARHAGARVILVGDIDRGGVFASFIGHVATFAPDELDLLAGFLVNKFRGDPALLGDAFAMTEDRTGYPVLGCVPMVRGLVIADEDETVVKTQNRPDAAIRIAVPRLKRVSNFTDFDAFASEPDVAIIPVSRGDELAAGDWDAVIIPGTKSTMADLDWLRESGLAAAISSFAALGGAVTGICGGFQMLGDWMLDPDGVESATARVPGLGLLSLSSTFGRDKRLARVAATWLADGTPLKGYEIHHGMTGPSDRACQVSERVTQPGGSSPVAVSPEAMKIVARSATGEPLGYGAGRVWGSYIHGIFDADSFRRRFLNELRSRKGL